MIDKFFKNQNISNVTISIPAYGKCWTAPKNVDPWFKCQHLKFGADFNIKLFIFIFIFILSEEFIYGTKDKKGHRTKDKGQMTKDKGQRTKDKG